MSGKGFERVDILFTCLSFGTTRDGFPSKVTSKLMKTPMKTGEKMNWARRQLKINMSNRNAMDIKTTQEGKTGYEGNDENLVK